MDEKDTSLFNLGKKAGLHQAFDLVAKRCTAADAETLRSIREAGDYKKMGLTWKEFCEQHLGVSKAFADRQIQYIEEYGAAYYRMAQVVQLSGDTYKLIADSVVDDHIEVDGERIPINRENRKQVAAAVKTLRDRRVAGSANDQAIGALRKQMQDLLTEAYQAARLTDKRLELLTLLMDGRDSLEKLTEELRCKTLVLG